MVPPVPAINTSSLPSVCSQSSGPLNGNVLWITQYWFPRSIFCLLHRRSEPWYDRGSSASTFVGVMTTFAPHADAWRFLPIAYPALQIDLYRDVVKANPPPATTGTLMMVPPDQYDLPLQSSWFVCNTILNRARRIVTLTCIHCTLQVFGNTI